MGWIKRLGYFNNITKGCESIANQMSHLIVGVLSPLPANTVSLRVSVAFYLSALLELPTGVLADVLGHRRTLAYGYSILALASLTLFFACHFSFLPMSLSVVVLSSVLAAIGGGLISGCLQSFMQDFIEREVAKSGEEGNRAEEMMSKAIALSQKYGNFFSGLLPTLVLSGVFVSYYFTGASEWALLIPVCTYGALSLFFFRYRTEEEQHSAHNTLAAHCSHYWEQLRLFALVFSKYERSAKIRFAILFFRMVLSILTVIHVNTYLMVSQLRQLNLQPGSITSILTGFCVLAAFDLAHYPKGIIVPFVSKRLRANQLLYCSLLAQILLASLALVCYRNGYTLPAIIGFALFFNAMFSPGHTTLQSILLSEVPEHLRASFFSVVQMVVLFSYGSYSAVITVRGIGIDHPEQIFLQLISLSGVGIVLALLFDREAWSAHLTRRTSS